MKEVARPLYTGLANVTITGFDIDTVYDLANAINAEKL